MNPDSDLDRDRDPVETNGCFILEFSGARLASLAFSPEHVFFRALAPKCGVSISTFFPLCSSENALKAYFFLSNIL